VGFSINGGDTLLLLLANFCQPEVYDFNLRKRFSMQKMAQICQILKNYFLKLQDFNHKFQSVAKNIEGFCFFNTFVSNM
jgi:hypothetical protein